MERPAGFEPVINSLEGCGPTVGRQTRRKIAVLWIRELTHPPGDGAGLVDARRASVYFYSGDSVVKDRLPRTVAKGGTCSWHRVTESNRLSRLWRPTGTQRSTRQISQRLRGGSRDSNTLITGSQPVALPIEPQPHRNRRNVWSSRRYSKPQPSAYQANVLPLELQEPDRGANGRIRTGYFRFTKAALVLTSHAGKLWSHYPDSNRDCRATRAACSRRTSSGLTLVDPASLDLASARL